MMYCKYCGNTIDDDSIYCSKCGRKIVSFITKPIEESAPAGLINKIYSEYDINSKKTIEKIPNTDISEHRNAKYKYTENDIAAVIVGIILIFIVSAINFYNTNMEGFDSESLSSLFVFNLIFRITGLVWGIKILQKKHISSGWGLFGLLSPGISLVVFGFLKPQLIDNAEMPDMSDQQKLILKKYNVIFYKGLFFHGEYKFSDFNTLEEYIMEQTYYKIDVPENIILNEEQLLLMNKYKIRFEDNRFVVGKYQFETFEGAIKSVQRTSTIDKNEKSDIIIDKNEEVEYVSKKESEKKLREEENSLIITVLLIIFLIIFFIIMTYK